MKKSHCSDEDDCLRVLRRSDHAERSQFHQDPWIYASLRQFAANQQKDPKFIWLCVCLTMTMHCISELAADELHAEFIANAKFSTAVPSWAFPQHFSTIWIYAPNIKTIQFNDIQYCVIWVRRNIHSVTLLHNVHTIYRWAQFCFVQHLSEKKCLMLSFNSNWNE